MDRCYLTKEEISNWPPEHRKIKINHRGVCVQIVLKILWKLYITKLFIETSFKQRLTSFHAKWQVFNVCAKKIFSQLSFSTFSKRPPLLISVFFFSLVFNICHLKWTFSHDVRFFGKLHLLSLYIYFFKNIVSFMFRYNKRLTSF